ncbi:unnamed protein product [Prorocentrum cordatum]|uniref:C3H1-type domain-containing protein n=1 Tax=Prorocentrum cordatum TaxID=2364126 RepID=A0ABN9V0I0_9DINO|nr:unnamed protein product [Polarella glacialis]
MSVPDEFRRQNLREKHVKQLVKTEMCKFFFLNKCVKGPSCPYAHSVSEIREKPDLGKTSMCPDFLATGNCTSLGCRFAHDERDLRTTSGFFKTKMCSFASSGRCKYGAACRFAHRPSEIHAIWPPSPGAVNPPLPLRPSGRDPAPPGPAAHGDGRASPPGRAGKAGDADQGAGRDVSSDQSTRDATSASRGGSVCASTPEGSGDSVQDGMSVRGVRRRRGQAAPARQCTTLVISNVPSFLTQGAVVSLLEDLTECMRGAFDFFYCPWNPNQDRNLGYAIINFFSRSAAAEFERRWANEPLLPGTLGAKKVKLVPAALQGRAANLRHFSGFSLAHHHDPRFRPLVRAAPDQVLRPMALPEEIQQGHASDSGHYPLEQRGLLEHGDLEEQGGVVDPCQELNLQSHAGERLRPSSCRTESQAMPSQERWS